MFASNPKCEICEHEITGLKNQVYYDINVRSVNKTGMSDLSNTITISPTGERSEVNLNNIFELDEGLLDKNINEQELMSTGCDIIGNKFNYNKHALNKKIPSIEELINYIKYKKYIIKYTKT